MIDISNRIILENLNKFWLSLKFVKFKSYLFDNSTYKHFYKEKKYFNYKNINFK